MKGKKIHLSGRIAEILKLFLRKVLILFSLENGKAKFKEVDTRTKEKERTTKLGAPLKVKIKDTPREKTGKTKSKVNKSEKESKSTKTIVIENLPQKEQPLERLMEEPKKVKEINKENFKEQKIDKQLREEKTQEITFKKVGRKPYIRKRPTEEIRKKTKRKLPNERESFIKKKKEPIDLGKARKRIYRQRVPSRQEKTGLIVGRKENKTKEEGIPIRIISPYLEIDLDLLEVSIVLPKQKFKVNKDEEPPPQLEYKIRINNSNEKEISVKVKKINKSLAQSQEGRILLDEPLKSLKVKYPEELKGKDYNYDHCKKIFYAFEAIGDNRGRMCYLYDKDCNYIPLPKKDVWIILNNDWELETEDVKNEDIRLLWNKYKLFLVNLKKADSLIIKNKKTGKREKLHCRRTFSIEGERLIEDDFVDSSPLFIGNTIKIRSLAETHFKWSVWIQNKEAGYKIVKEDWESSKELELKVPDSLPCDYGEFQVDICKRNYGEAEETIFFRWIDFIELNYPKNLIIPDPTQGGEIQILEIRMNQIEDWNLRCRENLDIKKEKGGYIIEVPTERDIVHLSFSKKSTPKNELKIQIRIPRLKWKITGQSYWSDRVLSIKRGILNPYDSLIVSTNDLRNKYRIYAIIEKNGNQLYETELIRKGVEYITDLEQFYETINKYKEELNIKLNISKDSKLLGSICVMKIKKKPETEKIKEKRRQRRRTKKILPRNLHRIYPVVKGKSKMRKGKGFSKKELIEAEIDIQDIYNLRISYDKRRKSSYKVNIQTLKKLKKGN